MANANFSQSLGGDDSVVPKRRFFISAPLLSIGLLAITLLVWGGLRLYIASIDKKISALETVLLEGATRLEGDDIDRIANFDARVTHIWSDPSEQVDPTQILGKLESLVVPQVILTKYLYDQQKKESMILGETDDFRYLAEQILSLKSEILFSKVVVDTIGRTESGRIQFTLRAGF